MGPFQRHRWFALAGLVTLAFALASALLGRGLAATAVFDTGYCSITLIAAAAMLSNSLRENGVTRNFWMLMAIGCLMWACDSGAWNYYELIRHLQVPTAWFMDAFLFLHLVPMIAAVSLRPHRAEHKATFRSGTLDFLLLLIWWVFLYAFLVFPWEYISFDPPLYEKNFASLYLLETGMFVLVLGIGARAATGGWRKVYLNLMLGSLSYAIGSQFLSVAIDNGRYYSGSLYDVPLVGAVSWMAATALTAPRWHCEAAVPKESDRWGTVAWRLATIAVLSLPVLGLWTFCWDQSPPAIRTFRLFTIFGAMLVLGAFLFVRQFLQDRTLIRLLGASRGSFENEQRLQTHLVQREKLASLGKLIAGAAHEIDLPLTAIMDYSEKLWSSSRLTREQDTLVRKIVNHAQRTRDLISNLLSFAQQTSAEKKMVDLTVLLQRSVQMRELQLHEQNIHIELSMDEKLPHIWGDGHQLFQVFVQIVENALDALEDAGGGVLQVAAQNRDNGVVIHFSDSGPGIREPHRVFDPFYTTKPIGKGTGLGLSAVYGVVQDHQGQITCHNKPEGGAVFVLRLPAASHANAQALAAARS
jgi:signal transduction histidine kinase